MSSILILLKKDWLELKKHAISLIFFILISPIFLHILLAIPLSNFIVLDVRYLNWSSAGIWIYTSSIIAFIIPIISIMKINIYSSEIDAILQTPISNYQLIISIIIKGFFVGFLQLFVAFIITSTLKQEYFNTIQVLVIFFNMAIIIMMFSSIGTTLGLMLSNMLSFIQIFIFFSLILCFGMGIFIPLDYFPDAYSGVVKMFPLTNTFTNVQSAIINESINWLSLFLTIIMEAIFIIVSFILSHKVFRAYEKK